MDKREFTDRLILAGQRARKSAATYVVDPLPEQLCCTVSAHDNKDGRRGPPGTIKFLGGRFLDPRDLIRIHPARAATLLWVDGMVPAWINIGVCDCDYTATELMIRFCGTLLPADVDRLPPDINMPPANELVPFRIRGPGDGVNWRTPNDMPAE